MNVAQSIFLDISFIWMVYTNLYNSCNLFSIKSDHSKDEPILGLEILETIQLIASIVLLALCIIIIQSIFFVLHVEDID